MLLAVLCLLPIIFYSAEKEYELCIPDALGTISEIRIYAKNDDALAECEEYIYKTDRLFSLSNPESEISRINRGEDVFLSPETEELLTLSRAFTVPESFNPFCGALINLWEEARAANTPPRAEDIRRLLPGNTPPPEITEHKIALRENQAINLGAIAKGYITDGINKILDSHNIGSGIIYLGGNVYARGEKSDKTPWKIGICDPDSPSEHLGILTAENIAVITSGDYERYFESDGKRYHHIIDPKTGYPAESGLRSVTVICKNGAVGDMLSTRCFIEGFEKSVTLLEEYDALAVFVTDDARVLYSRELKDIFLPTGEGYEYSEF